MEDRDLARTLGWLRIVLGAATFLAPTRIARGWTGDVADEPVARLALRGLGARDVAIGVGILSSMARGAPVRGWLEASAMADAADAFATVVTWRELPGFRRLLALGSEAGAAVFAFGLADSLD